jgi:hypothetical protein
VLAADEKEDRPEVFLFFLHSKNKKAKMILPMPPGMMPRDKSTASTKQLREHTDIVT